MTPLDQKINRHFPGLVVRKDLTKTVKGEDRYQVDILGEAQTAKPGDTIETKRRLFSGGHRPPRH